MLTREEARQILAARNENNEKQARALYDFEGERKKELTFSKVRETVVVVCVSLIGVMSPVSKDLCQNQQSAKMCAEPSILVFASI